MQVKPMACLGICTLGPIERLGSVMWAGDTAHLCGSLGDFGLIIISTSQPTSQIYCEGKMGRFGLKGILPGGLCRKDGIKK